MAADTPERHGDLVSATGGIRSEDSSRSGQRSSREKPTGLDDIAIHDPMMAGVDDNKAEKDLNVTEDDLLEAKELAATFSLDSCRDILQNVYRLHKKDPNFPLVIINKIEEFLDNDDIFSNPEKHEELITEMKIEAALITNNSPYAEVRSVVDNHDDPTMPCSTIRCWFMGLIFSAAISFINGFFEIRQPAIYVTSNVPQLLAYPFGKFLEKTLPDWGITLFGVRHSLNPGPFNKKEHMMIAIMASIAKSTPFTNYLVWIQYLPQYFNMPWAISFGYQILIALSTNFIGYGLAGLCRRFLVYPSSCVWPSSLVTIALNTAFHNEANPEAMGPFGQIWRWSRLKFFAITCVGMFAWFWLPNSLFAALTYFSWMTWISPNNKPLTWITGSQHGLGMNPFPTFDWNLLTFWVDPLMVPFFTTFNLAMGITLGFLIISGMYFTNALFTSYFPINNNLPYDNMAQAYNVKRIVDSRGIIDQDMYQAYSPPYLTAASATQYMSWFAVYTATVTYAVLFHRREIVMGFRDLVNSYRPSKKDAVEKGRALDVHSRLMKSYKEVPEWWYLVCLVLASILGCLGVGLWPTYTTPGVVFYGIALALVFVVPCGIIMAMTGVEISLNVLAEFIGGAWVEGNAISMCFFKSFGYITCSHALHFSQDLKLAHYLKIPPRMTFAAQMVPTIVSTFVCVGILQYQIHLPNICTPDAPFRLYCPAVNSYFTSAIMWGTVGPKKLWGVGGQYAVTLVAFPLGAAVVLAYWFVANRFPKNNVLRNFHPVVLFYGGIMFAPYNLTYLWPAVPVAFFSWIYLKSRYLGLWSKYNFVLSAAFSCGVALSAVVQFFALAFNNVEINWWGNTVIAQGCEGADCVRMTLAEGEYFGPSPGNYN